MTDQGNRQAGLEDTFFQLLRAGAGEMGQGGMIILLSLVNLMGIINIINYRLGVDKGFTQGVDEQPDGKEAPHPFDPAPLLSMLGGKGGAAGPQGTLADLMGRLMAPAGAQPPGATREAGGQKGQPGQKNGSRGAQKEESPGVTSRPGEDIKPKL